MIGLQRCEVYLLYQLVPTKYVFLNQNENCRTGEIILRLPTSIRKVYIFGKEI
jgi:hypothetical protein